MTAFDQDQPEVFGGAVELIDVARFFVEPQHAVEREQLIAVRFVPLLHGQAKEL